MARTISLLDQVRIASPCNVSWASMTGDAKVRHCGQRQLNVYNVVEMKRDEAEALIRDREGNRVCLRLHQRRDGTVITKDCPIGLARARRRLAKMVGGLAAMVAFVVGIGSVFGNRGTGGNRLRYFEPFERLANWLDPQVSIFAGVMRAPRPTSQPAWPPSYIVFPRSGDKNQTGGQ